MTSITVRKARVLSEHLDIDGRQFVAELVEPRQRFVVVLETADLSQPIELLGWADDEAGAIAAAKRLADQLQEFSAGHVSAGIIQ